MRTLEQAIIDNRARAAARQLQADRRRVASTVRALADWAGVDADRAPESQWGHTAAYWGRLTLRHLETMAQAIIDGDDYAERIHAEAARVAARMAAELAGFASGRADVLTTGELQPRLPADVGAVRDIEATARPLADLPFTLTAPVYDITDADQLSLLPSGLPEVSR